MITGTIRRMNTETIANKVTAFQLKGSLFTLTVMHLKSVDTEALSTQLAATIKSSPKFFENAPLVIDMHALATLEVDLNFAALNDTLRAHHLIPVGIRGASEKQQALALAACFAIFPNTKPASTSTQNTAIAPDTTGQATKIITQPVRSGQQIYAKNSDLLILSHVSHGAEVLADGHIHVYGQLRGRALAGITGNTDARIFCKGLEPELISIAGRYLVSEHIRAPENGQMVQIYLDDGHLRFDAV